MADIDTAERLLCERYNVQSLDGLGGLLGAIHAARAGDLAPLRMALDGRELYRWRAPIEAALTDQDYSPLVTPVEEASEELAPAASSEAQPGTASEFDAEPEGEPDEPVRHRSRRPRPDPE